MNDKYDFKISEPKWQDFWSKNHVYDFDPDSDKPLYTIDTPPPTISGALHLGHIYSYTQAEVIARYRRFRGFNVRYPFGMDNNGLPTERLVEKEMGIKGKDLSLKDFTEKCLATTEKYKILYEQLWQSLGLSVDWRLEYSTISEPVQLLVQKTFKDFFDRELIYRQEAPALFCFECGTSVAQAEVEEEEKESVFYDLAFTDHAGKTLVIATTRPELLPACLAIFVHPDDLRFRELVGTSATTPLGDIVPILTDEKVDMEKGSGAVMCCSYGDETDVYWVREHKLKEKLVTDRNGKFKNLSNALELVGLNFIEVRTKIVTKLEAEGKILSRKNISHNLGIHERCGTPIEYFTTVQWFVKTLTIKNEILEQGQKINWYPTFMFKRFEDWTLGLKWDWCISRERFYGIPLPAYTCDDCGQILVPEIKDKPLDPRLEKNAGNLKCSCGSQKLSPDGNVLDTWFTSSLTPDINNESPLNGRLKDQMFPLSMRPQAHDIIRTWAFYTVVMAYYRHQAVPWHDLMVSGHILAKQGVKISKKTGGGKYQPAELIAENSADAVRYVMCGAKLGQDAYYDEAEVEKGKKLVTKIFNAGKFVFTHLRDGNFTKEQKPSELYPADEWILAKAENTMAEMIKSFDQYDLIIARQRFEEFFWTDFCDNYLELAKGRL
ncbi:MAG: valine--tRNA ligase, partial [Candidatus Vogelbacteria bacterium]|nr:valine--tRNA ligase [Candidatus Vogelbacteria bacterium]